MTTRERITKGIAADELRLPLWSVEISVMEQPFPFAMKVHAFTEQTAFGKVEWRARYCGLTPALRLSCEQMVKP